MNHQTECWIPSSQVILSVVRKGELELKRKGSCEDVQDNQVIEDWPDMSCVQQVLSWCYHITLSSPLYRTWTRSVEPEPAREFLVLQWNMLSQALGTSMDNFISRSSLQWEERRWRVIQEIVRLSPDLICLQEVDHYRLLEKVLASLGYQGRFVPKPDSPCLYVEDNNGPDGCAIFYRADKFQCDRVESCVLSVWGVLSNQVAMAASLTHLLTGRSILAATTHLKARTGQLNMMMREEQGRHLVEWLDHIRDFISGKY